MSLKKRIEALEEEENGRDEFSDWHVTIEIGKETRTFARNSETGQESEDPAFIQRVDSWHRDRAKRLGIAEEFVVVAGEYTWKNGVLVSAPNPETISGIETAELIARGKAV